MCGAARLALACTYRVIRQIDYADESAAEAAKEDDDVNYLDLAKGCNGFPFSELRRAASAEECAGMGPEAGGATTGTTATTAPDAEDGAATHGILLTALTVAVGMVAMA